MECFSTKINTPKHAGHGHVSAYDFLMKVIDIIEGGSVPDIDQGT